MKEITRLEEIVLLSIWRLKDNAYGVTIKKDVGETSGKKITMGALYFTIKQLYKKGYLTKRMGDPTSVRGGKSKIYYNLSKKGTDGLQHARELQESIWKGVPKYAFLNEAQREQ